jgi:gas vesicle protein
VALGYRGGVVTGVALGIAAVLFAPALSRWGRPLAKQAIKGGLDAYESARDRLATLREQLEDLAAEAQFERLEAERPSEAPGAPADAASGAAAAEQRTG